MKKRLALILSLILFASAAGCTPSQEAPQAARAGVFMNDEVTQIIDGNGTLWSYGDNDQGGLGLGIGVMEVTNALPVMEDVVKVTGGDSYLLALKKNGTVWEWGRINGQTVYSPRQVFEGAVDIAAAPGGAIALTTANQVWGWGRGIYGIEGLEESQYYSQPYLILEETRSILAGYRQCGAISLNGDLFLWGTLNQELRPTPVKIAGNVIKASLGSTVYLLKGDGSLWGLGNNSYGQLGIGKAAEDYKTPKDVYEKKPLKIASGVSDFSAAGGSLYFLKRGELWGCGTNYYGQLGNLVPSAEYFDEERIEKKPVLIDKDVDRVYDGAVAVFYTKGTELWACGSNDSGLLGLGIPHTNLINTSSPMAGTPRKVLDGQVLEFYVEDYYAVCVLGDGSVKVWGRDPLHFYAGHQSSGDITPSSDPEMFTGPIGELINVYHFTNMPTDLPLPTDFVRITG